MNCKLCPKVLKYSGNTSNMRFHLQSSHKAEFKVLQQSEKHKDTGNNIQQTVKGMLQQTTPLLRDTLTQSVCYFVAKDMQPIDTINDKGFQAMIKKFEPRYTPPDRKTLSTKYLPQMYETEKKRISSLLGSAQHYACATDMWTSRAQHALY